MAYTSCLTSCERFKTYQEKLKTSENYNLVSSLSPKIKVWSVLAKTFSEIEIELFRNALFHRKTRVFPK